MFQHLLTTAAFVLLCSVAAGMVRVVRGPTAADRMMAAQLFGSCGLAILLVLFGVTGDESLLDIGLAYALLAALTTMTFVRRAWFAPAEGETDGADE